MQIIPEIVLLEGRAVQMQRGQLETAEDIGDPATIFGRYAAAGAPMMHVIDANGIFDGKPTHMSLLRKLATFLPVQYGGGLRERALIEQALEAGAARVVLGTAVSETPAIVQSIPRDRLVASVDVYRGMVVAHGWSDVTAADPGFYAAKLVADGVDHVLCTTVDVDGTEAGPDLDMLVKVGMCGGLVQAHGGVASLDDIRHIVGVPGVEAIVIGSALHHGLFTYEQAVEAVAEAEAEA